MAAAAETSAGEADRVRAQNPERNPAVLIKAGITSALRLLHRMRGKGKAAETTNTQMIKMAATLALTLTEAPASLIVGMISLLYRILLPKASSPNRRETAALSELGSSG